MTASHGPAAARTASTGKRRATRLRELCLASFFCTLLLAAYAFPAMAESVRVSVSADPSLSATQARQQALERALAEAVYKEAMRFAPATLAPARADALRASLAPHAIDFVQSYQDAAQPKPAVQAGPGVDTAASGSGDAAGDKPAGAPAAPDATQQKASAALSAAGGVADSGVADSGVADSGVSAPGPAAAPSNTFEFEVNVRRAALRVYLVRLGLLAGARHPGAYTLHLGKGVKEKDAAALSRQDVLLGLKRVRKAPQQQAAGDGVEVTLERLPQGYYKAVLRQGDIVIAADASTLPDLWLDVWGRYFADSRMQPGPGAQVLAISGFAGVDAVQDFVRLLASWDEAVQDPSLAGLDLDVDGVSARFTCRVVNQAALDARLRAALPERKLTLMDGLTGEVTGETPVGARVPAP